MKKLGHQPRKLCKQHKQFIANKILDTRTLQERVYTTCDVHGNRVIRAFYREEVLDDFD